MLKERLEARLRRVLGDALFQKILRNAGKLFSGSVVNSMLGLASMALAARALGAESFGTLILITTFVRSVDQLINFQSWQAMTRYGAAALEAGDREDFAAQVKLFSLIDGLSAVAGTAVAVLAAPLAGSLFDWSAEVTALASLFGVTILSNFYGVPLAILRLHDRYGLIAGTNIAASAVKLVLVVVAWLAEAQLTAFVATWAVGDVMGRLVMVVAGWRELRRHGYRGVRRASLDGIWERHTGLWRFIWTTNVGTALKLAISDLDVLVLGWASPPETVGIFETAKKFSRVLIKVVDPLYHVVYPELSRLASRGDWVVFRRAMRRPSWLMALVCGLAWVGFALLGPWIISWTVGGEFAAAWGPTLIYLAGVSLAVTGFALQPAMLAMGYPTRSFHVQVACIILYLPCLLALVQTLSYVGAAWAYVIYVGCWIIMMATLVQRTIVENERERA